MNIGELKNWTEVTRGIYRYVIAAGACYELHILRHEQGQKIEEAQATVFIVGDWYEATTGKDAFIREALVSNQTVSVCLAAALQDYLSNVE